MNKTCTICKKLRPLELFSKHPMGKNGLDPQCKKCRSLHYKEYAKKERSKSKSRARTKKYREAHKDILKARHKAVRNTLKGKARRMIESRLRKNTIQRQLCIVCKKLHQKEVKAQAHHSDYHKPLDIMWLCVQHHSAWHRVFIAEG